MPPRWNAKQLAFVPFAGTDDLSRSHFETQDSIDGPLATNPGNLSEGRAAYAGALGPEWRNTVVVVLSEFGRTFRENGDKGTDHGHGTTYWVMGGAVNGGRIAGEQVVVSKDTLFQDRDYPVSPNSATCSPAC